MRELMGLEGWFSPDPRFDARGAAMLAMSSQVGVPMKMLPRIEARHWCPGGRHVMDLDPNGYYGRRAYGHSRVIALTDTALAVIGHYIVLDPPEAPDAPLLRMHDGGAIRGCVLRASLRRALVRLGEPENALTLGGARQVFNRSVLGKDRTDGLPQYLAGHDRWAHADREFLYAPPPDEVARAYLHEVLPISRPWAALLERMSAVRRRARDASRRFPPGGVAG